MSRWPQEQKKWFHHCIKYLVYTRIRWAQRRWVKDGDRVSEYAVEVYICYEFCDVSRSSCHKCNEVRLVDVNRASYKTFVN